MSNSIVMSKKYCYRCGTTYTEEQCTLCGSDLYTTRPNARTAIITQEEVTGGENNET